MIVRDMGHKTPSIHRAGIYHRPNFDFRKEQWLYIYVNVITEILSCILTP